jgi:hypothetical protein
VDADPESHRIVGCRDTCGTVGLAACRMRPNFVDTRIYSIQDSSPGSVFSRVHIMVREINGCENKRRNAAFSVTSAVWADYLLARNT